MAEESTQFNCKEEGCTGIVVVSKENMMRFGGHGCRGISPDLYLCDKCGKLHKKDGTSAQNRGGNPFFCIDGRIGARQHDGEMIFI